MAHLPLLAMRVCGKAPVQDIGSAGRDLPPAMSLEMARQQAISRFENAMWWILLLSPIATDRNIEARRTEFENELALVLNSVNHELVGLVVRRMLGMVPGSRYVIRNRVLECLERWENADNIP